MPTKSIGLSEEEAAELQEYLEMTGEEEESVLKRAVLRGLPDLRLEQGFRAFEDGLGSAEAAEIAGLSRAAFLQELIDQGMTMLEGPSTLARELETLACAFGNERLKAAAKKRDPTNE